MKKYIIVFIYTILCYPFKVFGIDHTCDPSVDGSCILSESKADVLIKDDATLTIETGGQITNSVVGEINNKGNIVINVDQMGNTSFGTSSIYLNTITANNNFSINKESFIKLLINNGTTDLNSILNISDKFQNVGTLNITTNGGLRGNIENTGTTNLLTNNAINGTIDGGIVNIKTDYSSNDTIFSNTNIIVDTGKTFDLSNEATVTELKNNGTVNINSGGKVSGTVTNDNAELNVKTGGSIEGNVSNNKGDMNVAGSVTGDVNNTEGELVVESGGSISGTINNSSGNIGLESGGSINGNINNSDGILDIASNGGITGAITGGTVNINSDYDNTTGSTIFGTTGNSINQINVGKDFTFTVGNDVYTNSLNNSGRLDLISGANVHGNVKNENTGTINISTDLSADNKITNSGTINLDSGSINWGNNIADNTGKINYNGGLINGNVVGNNGTININLADGSDRTLNISNNTNGKVELSSGTITGNIIGGTVDIKTDYNHEGTNFGTSNTDKINTINIENGSSLTLSNNAYFDNLNNSGSLNLVEGSTASGTINNKNNGTIDVSTNLNTDTKINNKGEINLNSGSINWNNNIIDNTGGTVNWKGGDINGNITSNTGTINIDLTDSGDRAIDINNDTTGTLKLSNGTITGTITGGNVSIAGSYDYDGTIFGTETNAINKGTIETTGSFTVKNDVYIDNMKNLGSLTIEEGGKLNGTTVTGTGTINLNVDYVTKDNTAKFGENETNKAGTIVVIDGKNLTVNSDVFVDNIQNNSNVIFEDSFNFVGNVDNESGKSVTINTESDINGEITGGNVYINSNYGSSTSSTSFGTSTKNIENLEVLSAGTLNLYKDIYADKLNNSGNVNLNNSNLNDTKINNGGTLTLNSGNLNWVNNMENNSGKFNYVGGNLIGNIDGNVGTVNIDLADGSDRILDINNSDNGNLELTKGTITGNITGGNVIIKGDYNHIGTNFGTSNTNKVNNVEIGYDKSLTLGNTSFINNIKNSGELTLDNGSVLNGTTITGDGTINLNTDFSTESGGNKIGVTVGDKANIILAENKTLTLNTETYFGSVENKGNVIVNSAVRGDINSVVGKTVTINTESEIFGRIMGGDVIINSAYNNGVNTNFTNVDNLTIANGAELTLYNPSTIENFVNNGTLKLEGGSIQMASKDSIINNIGGTLNISNGGIKGTIVGGTVKISGVFDSTIGDTVFGKSDNKLDNLVITDTGSLKIIDSVYSDNLINGGNLEIEGATVSDTSVANTGLLTINNVIFNGTTTISNSKVNGSETTGIINFESGNLNWDRVITENSGIFNFKGGIITSDISNNTGTIVVNISDSSQKTVNFNNNAGIIEISQGSISGNIVNADNGLLKLKNDNSVNGTISGGSVLVESDYTSSNTVFGSAAKSIAQLQVNRNINFSLKNKSYIDKIANNGTVDLSATLNGSIVGGVVNVTSNYNTQNTNFGLSYDEKIDTINVKNSSVLNAMNSDIYAMKVVIDSGSTFTTSGSYANIYSNLLLSKNQNVNFSANKTTVYGNITVNNGSASDKVGAIVIDTGKTLTLKNNNNTISASQFVLNTNSLLEVGGTGSSTVTVTGKVNNATGNDYLIVSLNGNSGNLYKQQIADFTAMVSGASSSTVTVSDNVLMLKKFNIFDLKEGDSYIIADGDYSAYTNATLHYSSIYTKVSLKGTSTGLIAEVEMARNPYNDIVTSAGIAAGNIVNNWTFDKMDSEDIKLLTVIQSIKDDNEFFRALNEIAPDISGATLKTVFISNNTIFKNIQKRLNNIRISSVGISGIEKAKLGFYEDNLKGGLWGEVLGNVTNVKNKDNIYAYDIMQGGFILGYDSKINKYLTMGVSYGFSFSKITNDAPTPQSEDTLDVSSSNIGIYSMFSNNASFLNLYANATINGYSSSRGIAFEDYAIKANVSFNGIGYGAGATIGHTFLLNGRNNIKEVIVIRGMNKPFLDMSYYGMTITPTFSLLYSSLQVDKYVENDAGAANLEVKTKSASLLEASAGVSLSYVKQLYSELLMQTIISFYGTKNLIDYIPEVTARFVNDSNTFTVKGSEIAPITYNASFGFYIYSDNKSNYGIEYIYGTSDDIQSHTLRLNFLSRF